MPRPMHSALVRRDRVVPASMIMAVLTFVGFTVGERRSSSPGVTDVIAPGGLIRVEVADTATRRARGLSHRDSLKTGGFLLEWPTLGRHPIWMDGMRFGLDLVWLDQSGRVLALLTDRPPCVQQPCPLYEPAGTDRSVKVLELPSGGAARYRITTSAQLHINPATMILGRHTSTPITVRPCARAPKARASSCVAMTGSIRVSSRHKSAVAR